MIPIPPLPPACCGSPSCYHNRVITTLVYYFSTSSDEGVTRMHLSYHKEIYFPTFGNVFNSVWIQKCVQPTFLFKNIFNNTYVPECVGFRIGNHSTLHIDIQGKWNTSFCCSYNLVKVQEVLLKSCMNIENLILLILSM